MAPSTLMARAPSARLFGPGQAPKKPMEILGEMTLDVSQGLSRKAALKMLQRHAEGLGADAVVDVVLEMVERELPAQELTGIPRVAMGTLLSLMTWDLAPFVDAAREDGAVFKRKVLQVRGVAVKFFR
jgi:hypothetical protein